MSIPDPVVLLDARARYVHPAFELSRASTKTVWDSAGRLVTVPANAIGWDHDPATGQARGYLAELSATNLLLHSNDLDQSAWGPVNASITPDAIAGPDGNGMAKLVEDTTANQHRVVQIFSISSGTTVVGQCIVAAAERSAVRLLLGDSAVSTDHISITADCGVGSVLNVGANGNAVVVGHGLVPIGAGLWLVWIAGTVGDEATSARFQVSLSANGNLGYEGDGTSGLYVGYCQAEEGSYPTSYIETGAATATRSLDSLVLSDLGDFPWWRSERGTLLVDVEPPNNPYDQVRFLFDIGTAIRLSIVSNGILRVHGSYPNNDINIHNVVNNPLERSVVCVAWDQDEVACSMNGDIVGTVAAAGSALSATALALGNFVATNRPLGGRIRRAVYYPARLSNADLQSLTAIQE